MQTTKALLHPSVLLNANDRPGVHERARLVRDLNQFGWLLFGRKLQPVTERQHVAITFCFPPDVAGRSTENKRRDAANWQPTAKALVDGLTRAHVWPDDNDDWVEGPDCRLGPQSPDPRKVEVWITLTPKPKPVKIDRPRADGALQLCFGRKVEPVTGGEVHYFCTRQPHGAEAKHRAVSDRGEILW